MKKQFLVAAILMISSIAAFAYSGGKKEKSTRTWAASQAYSAITIRGNLDVYLAENNGSVIRVEGDEKDVNNVSFSVEKGRLLVKGKESFISGKLTVYIPVHQLKQLTVEGDVRLNSIGHLNSDKLNIRIAADCVLNLVSTGQVEIVADEENGYYFSAESRKRTVF